MKKIKDVVLVYVKWLSGRLRNDTTLKQNNRGSKILKSQNYQKCLQNYTLESWENRYRSKTAGWSSYKSIQKSKFAFLWIIFFSLKVNRSVRPNHIIRTFSKTSTCDFKSLPALEQKISNSYCDNKTFMTFCTKFKGCIDKWLKYNFKYTGYSPNVKLDCC